MPKGDREIFKADIEDGYTRISNLLLEALALADLPGVQTRICLYLVRRTYAWGLKSARIKLQEFVDACGSDKPYISRQIKELIKKHIILRHDSPYGQISPEHSINTHLNLWTCLDIKKLHLNFTQGLYKGTIEDCTNIQQPLYKTTTPPLYKSTIQGLHNSTTVRPDEPSQDKASEHPKEMFKENIKEIDAADDDISATEIKSGSGPPDDLKAVCEYFAAKVGRIDVTNKDFAAIKAMLAEPGMTKEIVIAGIDKSFANYKPVHNRDKIRSFSYCEPAIMDEYQRVQIQNGGDEHEAGRRIRGPTNRRTSKKGGEIQTGPPGGLSKTTESKDYTSGKYGGFFGSTLCRENSGGEKPTG